MPIGIHGFEVRKQYLGSFVGDDHNDEVFKAKLDRIVKKMASIYGWGGFSSTWTAFKEKPYKPMTKQQKYKRAVTKCTNEHKKKLQAIRDSYNIFEEDLLAEERTRFLNRLEVLQKRYQ